MFRSKRKFNDIADTTKTSEWNNFNYTNDDKHKYIDQLTQYTSFAQIKRPRFTRNSKTQHDDLIAKLGENINSSTWISASQTKYFLLNDQSIDWFSKYYDKYGIFNESSNDLNLIDMNKKQNIISKNNNFTQQSSAKFLCDGGNIFEEKIYDEMKKKYKNDFVIVLDNNKISKYQERKDINSLIREGNNKVKELMEKGIPMIAQAPLINDNNFTYGVADILIRSDYLSKVFKTFYKDDEINYPAPLFEGKKYHYRIIDIKWTTMTLCVDGRTLRNEGYFPAYKGQLAIYTACLESLQGYVPNYAYIMAKAWKIAKIDIENNHGESPFDRLGIIDYKSRDNVFLKKTKDAVQWIQRVLTEGNNWRYGEDKPSTIELYPNMNKSFDSRFDKIKHQIASKYNEITQIWYVNSINRQNAFSKGIYSTKDPRCTSKTLGITSKTRGPIIDAILNINRNEYECIKPNIIKNNTSNWQKENELEYYIDFETINYNLFINPNEINLEQTCYDDSGITFMIGCGFKKNIKINSQLLIESLGIDKNKYNYVYNCIDNWEFVNIYITNFQLFNELEIYRIFFQFIIMRQHLINTNSNNQKKSKLFHWTDAELRFMEKAIDRIKTGKYMNDHLSNTSINLNNKNYLSALIDEFNNSVEWIDMCDIFINEPIVVKGAHRFKLKQIGHAFYNNGFIKTKWESGKMSDGFKAMIEAIKLYRSNNIVTNENQSFSEIVKYNEIDCKVIWEIVCYLRENHCK